MRWRLPFLAVCALMALALYTRANSEEPEAVERYALGGYAFEQLVIDSLRELKAEIVAVGATAVTDNSIGAELRRWMAVRGERARGVGSARYGQQVWTFDGTGPPTVVYGYYIVQAVSGTLMFAERFTAPPTIANRGDQVKVIPSLDAYSREEIHA